jgi:hypothetical protein
MTDLSILNLSISGPFDMKINKNKNNCENYKISGNQNILIKFKDEQTLKLLFLSNNITMYCSFGNNGNFCGNIFSARKKSAK